MIASMKRDEWVETHRSAFVQGVGKWESELWFVVSHIAEPRIDWEKLCGVLTALRYVPDYESLFKAGVR